MTRLHYYCSFCGKSEKQVRVIVAGPDVDICDECSDIAHQIVTDVRYGCWRHIRFAECQEPRS